MKSFESTTKKKRKKKGPKKKGSEKRETKTKEKVETLQAPNASPQRYWAFMNRAIQ